MIRLLFAALLVTTSASTLAQPAPDALIKATSAEVLGILKDDAAAGRTTDVAKLVETRVLPLFDFQRMTAMAVARNWRAATPVQQEALVLQFRTLLVRTYSSALAQFRDQPIEYRPLRAAAADEEVVVRSFLRRSGAEPLTIDYDMEKTPTGWKVFDVKIAGVSLVMNYRESFANAYRSGGIEALIKSISDKNLKGDPDPSPRMGSSRKPTRSSFPNGSRTSTGKIRSTSKQEHADGRSSSPLSVTVWPEYLPNSTRSPTLTSSGTSTPFSVELALADGHHLALVGLLGGGVRDDDAGGGLLFLVEALDDHSIV